MIVVGIHPGLAPPGSFTGQVTASFKAGVPSSPKAVMCWPGLGPGACCWLAGAKLPRPVGWAAPPALVVPWSHTLQHEAPVFRCLILQKMTGPRVIDIAKDALSILQKLLKIARVSQYLLQYRQSMLYRHSLQNVLG